MVNSVVLHSDTAGILGPDQVGQLFMFNNFIFHAYVINHVTSPRVALGYNYSSVIVEREFICELITEGTLENRHFIIERLKI